MAYVEDMAAGDEAEKAVIYFDCPEALAAVYDFIKIKFVPELYSFTCFFQRYDKIEAHCYRKEGYFGKTSAFGQRFAGIREGSTGGHDAGADSYGPPYLQSSHGPCFQHAGLWAL